MYWTKFCRPAVNVRPNVFEKHLSKNWSKQSFALNNLWSFEWYNLWYLSCYKNVTSCVEKVQKFIVITGKVSWNRPTLHKCFIMWFSMISSRKLVKMFLESFVSCKVIYESTWCNECNVHMWKAWKVNNQSKGTRLTSYHTAIFEK